MQDALEPHSGDPDPIRLTPEDQIRLAEILLNPPPLTPAMERARAIHQRLALGLE
jgi:hypothetical protein